MLRILAIDDSPKWRDLLSRVFEGHLVTGAATACDGLTMLAAQTFDVVLVDGALPDAMGPDLVNLIRLQAIEREQAVPLLLGLTGYPHMAVQFERLHVPALLKGCSVLALRRTVEALAAGETLTDAGSETALLWMRGALSAS